MGNLSFLFSLPALDRSVFLRVSDSPSREVLWEYFQFKPLGGALNLAVVYQRAGSDSWIKSKDFGGNCSDMERMDSFLSENLGFNQFFPW